MRIGAVLRRWIEILAALYLAWRESRRELRSLVVTRENGHVVVRHAEPARDAKLRDAQAGNFVAILPPGAEVSADVSRAAHNSFVILEFPADKVVMRRITVPAQARKFLSGVIRNQIERLSPWLESGTPYVFVDALTVQPAGAVAGRAVEDTLLRTTLSLRAFWRRGAS
jgi:general secretion pathway protein L